MGLAAEVGTHSGHHAEQAPVIDCFVAQFVPTWSGFVGKVTWALYRGPNTRIHPSKSQRVRAEDGDYLAVR